MAGRLHLFAALFAATGLTGSETGRPEIRVFTDRELPADLEIFSLARDPRTGLLYLGGRGRVVEFDGRHLRELPVPPTVHSPATSVSSVAVGPDGSVYFCHGFHAFAFPAGGGGLGPLRKLTDPDTPGWEGEPRVRSVACDAGGAWFLFAGRLGRWHDDRWQLWPVDDSRETVLLKTDGRVHVKLPGRGLYRIDGNRFVTVLDGGGMDGQTWTAVEHGAAGRWQVVATSAESHTWWTRVPGGNATRSPAAPSPPGIILQKRVNSATFLPGGRLGTALNGSGLVWRNADGRVQARLDSANGLPSSAVHFVMPDRDGGVSALANYSLLRAGPVPAITRFDRLNGLRGRVQTLARHAGRLYAGTDEGVFVLQPVGADGSAAEFTPVSGLGHDCQALLSHEDNLFVANREGIHVLQEDRLIRLAVPASTALSLTPGRRRPGHVYYGLAAGIGRLRRDGNGWKDEGANTGFSNVTSLVETTAGHLVVGGGRNQIWLASPQTRPPAAPTGASLPLMGLLTPRRNVLPDLVYSMQPVAGPTGPTGAVWWRGQAWAFGENGLFGLAPDGRPLTAESLPALLPATHRLRLFAPAADEQAWAALAPSPDAAADGLGWRLVRLDERGRETGAISANWTAGAGEIRTVLEEISPADGRVLWIGGSSGLLRVETAGLPPPAPAPAVLIRRPAPAPADDGSYAHSPGMLRFDFAAPWFLSGPPVACQTRLAGLSEAWSEFSPGTHREFPPLPAGSYRFEVRARTPDGILGPVTGFGFTVLPPWWQAWWAYGLYGLGAAGAIAGLVRWRSRALRRRNEELERIVAARTSELAGAKAAAEAGSQAKSAFLASMSHELRTPLNAILGFAQILRRAPDLSEEHRQRLGVIGRNGDHLLQMINEILDLSKIEAGKLALQPRATDLPRLVQGLADTFSQRAADKGLEFRREIARDLPAAVLADEVQLRQVLINLLGNAVKFTEAGSIVFAVRPVGATAARFSVTDTGPGIPPAEQTRIFEPFYQTGGGPAPAGTGLGLAISQRIVGLMGGTIRCESGPGAGSRFWFELSLPATAAAPGPAADGVVIGYAGRRRRLLVVDDEPSNREVLRTLLVPLGFGIEECADGRACLAAFRRQPADAVLLDLCTPGELDGYATARALRALPGGGEPAIIAVSASVFEEDRQTALDAGCDAFVPKPFTEERLFTALGDCLDLQWILQGAAVEDGRAGPAALPADAVEKLRDFARRGDIMAFRERVRSLAGVHPESAAVLTHLDSLAAGFQLGRLRQELRAIRSTPSRPPL